MNKTPFHSAALALYLLASLTGFAPSQTAVPAAATLAPDEIAARGKGSILSFDELDTVLLLRHARSETGKGALRHLLEAGILEVLAKESSLTISDELVEKRWQEIDAEIRSSGQASGLAGYLAQSKVDVDEFRAHLRPSLVHEVLARRGLGIPESRPISPEQLQNWLNSTLAQRELTQEPAPWKDGVVARCAGLVITIDELLAQLRKDVTDDDLTTLCYQTLLAKRIAERMPDLTPETKTAALDREIQRRREKAAANPRYKGIPFEQILGAQGVDVTKLHLDPAIRVSAWAHLWVDRKYDEAGLRASYQEDRDRYDQQFGEAIETWVHFIRAAEFKNDLNPRDFEGAMREATRLAENISSLPQFQYEIRRSSEDRATREKEGFWGWITQGTAAVDEAARQEIFDALRSGRYDPSAPADDEKARLLGPIRGTNGVLLLWLGGRRPAPTWDEMKIRVHSELRRRFLDEVLPKKAVRTWRDE